MKTIGLIGGMSWESTLEYYRIINETVKEKLQHQGEWEKLTELMIDAAKRVEKGGADFILLCTNTMHKMANEVQNNIKIPLLHIADATAKKIREKDLKKIGLLGTKFTMEEYFYKGRLAAKYSLDVIIPYEKERLIVHDIIYNELCLGYIKHYSKEQLKKIIQNLVANGAEGIILGCTEIPLLIKQEDAEVELFDTTLIHARAAVKLALKE